MKKFSTLLLFMLLFGCSSKETINILNDEVNSITFNVGSINYEIKEDKYEDIVSILNEQELSRVEKVDDEGFWSVSINTNETQTIGIQPNGNIIIKDEDTYYEYEGKDTSLYDLYTEVMGKEIFHGLINPFDESLVENEWVYDHEIRNIFHVNVEEIEEISILEYKNNRIYTLKNDKVSDFVDAMNTTEYFYCGEGGLYGAYPATINLLFKDDTYLTINILNESIDGENAIHFVLDRDQDGYPIKERSYRIEKGQDLFNAFKEIVGNDYFNNFDVVPSNEWLENE